MFFKYWSLNTFSIFFSSNSFDFSSFDSNLFTGIELTSLVLLSEFALRVKGELNSTFFNFCNSSKDKQIALNAIEKVGIRHLKDNIYSQISGGERQLAFIARALTQESKIIFMDEPVTGLDYGNQLKLLKFLKELCTEGYTFVKTTHYPDHALYASNKVMMLKDGKILDNGLVDDKLTVENINKLYDVNVEIIKRENGYKFCIPII